MQNMYILLAKHGQVLDIQEEFLLRRWKSRNLIKHKSYNEMQYAEYAKYAKYTQYCYILDMQNIDPPLSI